MHGYRTKAVGHAYARSAEGSGHNITIAGVHTDALVRLMVMDDLARRDLSDVPVVAAEWEGEARLRQIPNQVRELMAAFNSGVLSGAVCDAGSVSIPRGAAAEPAAGVVRSLCCGIQGVYG